MKEIKHLGVMIAIALPVSTLCSYADVVGMKYFFLYLGTLPLIWVISKIICKYMEWNK